MKALRLVFKNNKKLFANLNRKFSQHLTHSISLSSQELNKLKQKTKESEQIDPISLNNQDLNFTSQRFKISSLKRINYQQIPQNKDLLKKLLQISEENEKLFDFIYQYLNIENQQSEEILNLLANYFNTKFVKTQTIKRKKPVITIMGHVDHGKTTLLDFLRNSDIAASEVGGITQKIGGFTFESVKGPVSFIDTPGHSLFKTMRETGIGCADYVVVIVSAVEGIKNQTKEVLDMVKRFNLPFAIALNKIDLPNADIEQVEEELVDYGVDLEPYGGNVVILPISAKTGENCELLVEFLVQESERINLRSDFDNECEVQIIEGYSQGAQGRKKASVVVKSGILKFGSLLTYEGNILKVSSIKNYQGENSTKAFPGDIVELEGFQNLPKSGQILLEVKNSKISKIYSELFQNIQYFQQQQQSDGENQYAKNTNFKIHFANKKEQGKINNDIKFMQQKMRETAQMMVREIAEMQKDETLSEQIELIEKKKSQLQALNSNLNMIKEEEIKENSFLIKTSDIGTKIALQQCLEKIVNPKFHLIDIECSPLTEDDIVKCQNLKGNIILFDVEQDSLMKSLAYQMNVKIIQHNIIYKLIEEFENLKGSTQKQKFQFKDNTLGYAKVLQVIYQKRLKLKICGVLVEQGFIHQDQKIRLFRDGEVIEENIQIQSMKHFRENVEELNSNQEGGISFKNEVDFKEGDFLECYFNQFLPLYKFRQILQLINGRIDQPSVQIGKRIFRVKILPLKIRLRRITEFAEQIHFRGFFKSFGRTRH